MKNGSSIVKTNIRPDNNNHVNAVDILQSSQIDFGRYRLIGTD